MQILIIGDVHSPFKWNFVPVSSSVVSMKVSQRPLLQLSSNSDQQMVRGVIIWVMNWFFTEGDQSTASINGDYSFLVEQQPQASLAETNSNLSVISYKSKVKKDALPAKVKWWKVKNGQSIEVQGVRGSMYPCQPSDLGYQIKAEINSVDDENPGTALVLFGPIKIQAGIRQTLSNIVAAGHTSFPVYICSGKDAQREAVIRINETQISVVSNNSNKTLKFPFDLSEPRIELNNRDLYRLCLRFREDDHETSLKNFMNESFGLNMSGSRLKQSSRLFKPDNKLELRFVSRHSRDLMTFSIRAFGAKRDMVSSAIIQRIERLDLSQEQQFKSYFEYVFLREEVIRMDQLYKEAVADRERKTRDLRNLEEEIANIKTTYLNIINDKCRDKDDLDQSISKISNNNFELRNKNKLEELQAENNQLKLMLRDQREKVDLLKFFGKNDNKTSNYEPDNKDAEKNRDASSPFRKKRTFGEEQKLQLHRSNSQLDIENILDTLGEAHQQTSAMVNPSFFNQSMNESAEIRLLEEKFNELRQINEKLLKEKELYAIQREGTDRQIKSLRREELHRPKDSMILPPNINSMEAEQELEKLKLEYKKLNNKYMGVLELEDLKQTAVLQAEYRQVKSSHEKCGERIRSMELEIQELERSKLGTSTAEVERYRLINNNLLTEINNLKIQVNKLTAEKTTSCILQMEEKIFCLEKQLEHINKGSDEPLDTKITGELFAAISRIKELEEQNNLKDVKIKTLDGIIEKLMNEVNQRSFALEQSNQSSNSLAKYKNRVKELESENDLLKRSTNALNKSRDLSMEMSEYNSEMMDTLRSEMEGILKENERISSMCERYAKDAKELNKVKQENVELRSELSKIQRR